MDTFNLFSVLSFNARLLMQEIDKRGIDLQLLGPSLIVKAQYKKHTELFYDIYSTLIPYPQGIIIDDKYYSKKLLERFGFKVAYGRVFTKKQIKEALAFARELEFPVVLKPTTGSHGEQVYLDIATEKDLQTNINLFLKSKAGNGYFLIEKQVSGNEYRLFITSKGFFAVVQRIPANVVGDGKNNIAYLIKQENQRRMNPRNTCLCEIKLDQITLDFLKKAGKNLSYIPKKDEKVFIRQNSNVSTGGNCNDMTEKVHPSVRKLAKRIINLFKNVPALGIDLLCNDINKPLKDYVICELNGAPGLSLHMMPEKGKSRNVAKAIVDIIFPETTINTRETKRGNQALSKLSQEELVKMGGKAESVPDTNASFVTINKQRYFFIGEYNESTPLLYGIFKLSPDYLKDLHKEGIKI